MSDVRPSTGALRAPAQDEVQRMWHLEMQMSVRPHSERREAAVEGRAIVMQRPLPNEEAPWTLI